MIHCIIEETYSNDVESVGAADRGAEPDLLVGRLFVDDVGPVLVQLDSENPVREGGVSPHQTVVVLDQLAEPVVEALQGLVAQLEVVVEVNLRAVEPLTTIKQRPQWSPDQA